MTATSQPAPEVGETEPGPTAVPYRALGSCFRGAKFAVLAVRSRYRDMGEGFRDDLKGYAQMVERYMEALPYVEERKT